MPEIVVIGAGFVGLSFALSAHRQGFAVEVYDRIPRPVAPVDLSSQVIALNAASRHFLEETSVWQRLPARFATAYNTMSVFDGEGTGAISFTAEEAGIPSLGTIVDQLALRAALADQAEDEGLAVNWQTTANIDDLERELLVAADGVHSATREKLGLRKIGYPYDQYATVCVATFSRPHGQHARQWFLAPGPLALLPLGETDKAAVVWSSSEDLSSIDERAFVSLLAEATESTLGEVLSVSGRASFPLMQQQALQYVTAGAALLGDAAHAIHPLAGQGANLGFADASALVTELCSARLTGARPGDLATLKRYERRRKTDNHLAAMAMEGFHRLFISRSPIMGLLRSRGLRFVHENKQLKRLAISVASGLV